MYRELLKNISNAANAIILKNKINSLKCVQSHFVGILRKETADTARGNELPQKC